MRPSVHMPNLGSTYHFLEINSRRRSLPNPCSAIGMFKRRVTSYSLWETKPVSVYPSPSAGLLDIVREITAVHAHPRSWSWHQSRIQVCCSSTLFMISLLYMLFPAACLRISISAKFVVPRLELMLLFSSQFLGAQTTLHISTLYHN